GPAGKRSGAGLAGAIRGRDRVRMVRRAASRHRTRLEFIGTACVWWGIWIAAASAGWWVAVWTLIGPILVTVLRSRARR
ncbi:MAG: DUF1295 domain-containing protein, partial [Alphaproteobacteria bacterium]|nr:DUF1295 domain-containing protein [Alphaproteobacteria bacterium]MBU1757151.1 DUF1295 domain-containing protein [Alphaproteobacteria bacterium]